MSSGAGALLSQAGQQVPSLFRAAPRPRTPEQHAALHSPSQPCVLRAQDHQAQLLTLPVPQTSSQSALSRRARGSGRAGLSGLPRAAPPPRPRPGREGGAAGRRSRAQRRLPPSSAAGGERARQCRPGAPHGPCSGLGGPGGAPAARGRPAGAVPVPVPVPVRARAARSPPRPALPLPCPALPRRVSPAEDCGAGSPGLSDYVFRAVQFGPRGKGWGRRRAAQGGGRRGLRAGLGQVLREPGAEGPCPRCQPRRHPRPEGPAENVCRSWALCVCRGEVCLSSFWERGDLSVNFHGLLSTLIVGLQHFKEKKHPTACGGMVGGRFLHA